MDKLDESRSRELETATYKAPWRTSFAWTSKSYGKRSYQQGTA
jgi:hypothetical protein